MSLEEIVIAILPLIQAMIFFLLFEAFLYRRPLYKHLGYIFAGYIALAAFIKLCNWFLLTTFFNIIFIIFGAFFIACIFYEGSYIKKLLITVIAVLISGVSEVFSIYFVTFIFDISINETLNIPEYNVLSIIIDKAIALLICNIIRIKHKKQESAIGREYWLMFFLLFGSATFTMFVVFRLTYELEPAIYQRYAMMTAICACGLFLSTFFSIYLYERLAKQSEAIRFQERYEEHLKFQLKHLNDLIAKQDEIRSMKHDMTNQLITLQGYFNRHDEEGGNAYIAQLLQTQHTIDFEEREYFG